MYRKHLACAVSALAMISLAPALAQEVDSALTVKDGLGNAQGLGTVSVGGVLAPAFGALADRAGLVAALAGLLGLPVLSLLISTRLTETRHQARQGGS